jgi:serine/threonine-protein kinase
MTGVGIGFRMAATRLTVSVDERTRLAQKRVGELVLGKWRLDRLIGVGGTAAVFEASHKNDSRVAIKILHPDLAVVEEVRERFLVESYAANRVAHPGVVPVRDEGTTADGTVFLVMDLLRGQTLAERLEERRAPFSVGEVLEIAAQLLDVLAHAHARGIVQRDIKPENVFLARDGRVRLLDFGLARVEASAHTHESEAGTTLGTPAFMPPEQALGNWAELDGRSDLWSLGATMYLLLSSTPVRERGSVTEQLLGAMTRPVPSLGRITALPRSVVAVVDRALAFDREARFPDAGAMQLAVRAVQNDLPAADARATLPPLSIEPVALSLRTPRPHGEAPSKGAPTPNVRPLSTTTPLPTNAPPTTPSALPLFVTLGFAVGLSIVIVARLSVHSSGPPTSAAQAVVSPLEQVAVPPPSAAAKALGSASAEPKAPPLAGAAP